MRRILDQTAYRDPQFFRQVLTAEELETVMLVTDGEILAQGVIWKIWFEEISPGVYKIWLERKP